MKILALSGSYRKKGYTARIVQMQCTSWARKGYVFDACVHSLNGFKPHTSVNTFWQELGAMPCELVERKEFVSAVLPDGTYFHNYFDLEKLESHLKQLSPEDTAVIDEYIILTVYSSHARAS